MRIEDTVIGPETVHIPVEWPMVIPCDLFATEVAYCLYYPLSTPGNGLCSLDGRNDLKFVQPMLDRILELEPERAINEYVYLTVKRMIVGPGITANRPGWHADGFGTDELNFIWYDGLPTLLSMRPFDVSPDHNVSLEQFDAQAEQNQADIMFFPPYNIIRLTPNIVHRVQLAKVDMMRTFVKVTISKEKFNLEGNSTNPNLPAWKMYRRGEGRNLTAVNPPPQDDHVEIIPG